MKRKMALQCTPTLEFTVDGDTITAKLNMGPKTECNTFKLDEEKQSKIGFMEGMVG